MEERFKPLKGVQLPGCKAIAGFINGLASYHRYAEYVNNGIASPNISPISSTGAVVDNVATAQKRFEYSRQRLDAAVKHASHYPSWSAMFDDLFYRLKVAFSKLTKTTGLTGAEVYTAADTMYRYVFNNTRSTLSDRTQGNATIDNGNPWSSSHGGSKFTNHDFWFGATFDSVKTWKDKGNKTVKGCFKDVNGNYLDSFPNSYGYFINGNDFGYSTKAILSYTQSGTSNEVYPILRDDSEDIWTIKSASGSTTTITNPNPHQGATIASDYVPMIYEKFKLTDIIDISGDTYETPEDKEWIENMWIGIPAASGATIPVSDIVRRSSAFNHSTSLTTREASDFCSREYSGLTYNSSKNSIIVGNMGGYARDNVAWWPNAYQFILHAIGKLYPYWKACGFSLVNPERKTYHSNDTSILGWLINWVQLYSHNGKDTIASNSTGTTLAPHYDPNTTNKVYSQLLTSGAVTPYTSVVPFIRYSLKQFSNSVKYTGTNSYYIDTSGWGWGGIVAHENGHVLEHAYLQSMWGVFFEGTCAALQGYAGHNQTSQLTNAQVFKITGSNDNYTITLPDPQKELTCKSTKTSLGPCSSFMGIHDCPWRTYQAGFAEYNHGYMLLNFLMTATKNGWDRQYKKCGKNHGYIALMDAFAESLVGSGNALTDRTLSYTKSTISDSAFAAVTVTGLNQ